MLEVNLEVDTDELYVARYPIIAWRIEKDKHKDPRPIAVGFPNGEIDSDVALRFYIETPEKRYQQWGHIPNMSYDTLDKCLDAAREELREQILYAMQRSKPGRPCEQARK